MPATAATTSGVVGANSVGVLVGVFVGKIPISTTGVSEGVGVSVGVSVGTGVSVGVSVGTGVSVGVSLGVGVSVGVCVSVWRGGK